MHIWNSLRVWVLHALLLFINHGRNNESVLESDAEGGRVMDRDAGVDLHCTLNLEGVVAGYITVLKSFCVVNVLFRPWYT